MLDLWNAMKSKPKFYFFVKCIFEHTTKTCCTSRLFLFIKYITHIHELSQFLANRCINVLFFGWYQVKGRANTLMIGFIFNSFYFVLFTKHVAQFC